MRHATSSLRADRPSRRDLLRSLGAGAALVPFVPRLEREALAASPAKRLIVVGQCHGVHMASWRPVMTADGWDLGATFAPLAPYKQGMTMVDGVGVFNVSDSPVNDDHGNSARAVFTGWVDKNPPSRSSRRDAMSFDQFVAEKVTGADNLFPSLQFGVFSASEPMFYREYGPGQTVDGVRRGLGLPSVNSPATMFERIFAGRGAGSPDAQRRLAQRASVLDHLRNEITSLQKKLSGDDQRKLTQHLESVRAVEALIQRSTKLACEPPAIEPGDAFPARMRAQIQLMVSAFSCDVTRVMSLKWGGNDGSPNGRNETYSWLGVTEGWHGLAHNSEAQFAPKAAKEAAGAEMLKMMQWHAAEVRLLLDGLAAAKETDGSSVLDHTVLVWACCLGGNHQKETVALMLFGGSRTGLPGNRVIRVPAAEKRCPNDVWTALLRLWGLDLRTFGEPARNKGPLPGLV
jgi:hypothetical protein